MSIDTSRFIEKREHHGDSEREALLARRIADLGLKVQGTRIERLVQELYGELDRAGIQLRPPVYLSDEWGCPEGTPIVGVPFYLADEKLTRLEEEMMEAVEAETDDEILRYLRHEVGHAFNYAYRLYETLEWQDLFGPYTRPYLDDYTPQPFSHSYVRHLPGWYAQKHPDEDFAETFAVWLTPTSNWREVYKDWDCFRKLKYVDNVVRQLGRTPPPVSSEGYDTAEEALRASVAEHYQQVRSPLLEIQPYFDSALRDIFEGDRRSRAPESDSQPAAAFLSSHRRTLTTSIMYWTGLNDTAVKSLLRHVSERCRKLDLRIRVKPERALIDLSVMLTTLCMNRLYRGEFVVK
jgi:hypothetical protein